MGLFGKSDKEKAEELWESAVAKSTKNDRQGAAEDLTRIIAITPNAHKMYYHRGNEYYSLNLFDKAIKDFQTALDFEPNNDKYILCVASCKRQIGDIKGAYRD